MGRFSNSYDISFNKEYYAEFLSNVCTVTSLQILMNMVLVQRSYRSPPYTTGWLTRVSTSMTTSTYMRQIATTRIFFVVSRGNPREFP